MRESPPHKKRFLRSRMLHTHPSCRLAEHLTFRFALGASNVRLVGETAPSRHCKGARVYGHTVMHDLSKPHSPSWVVFSRNKRTVCQLQELARAARAGWSVRATRIFLVGKPFQKANDVPVCHFGLTMPSTDGTFLVRPMTYATRAIRREIYQVLMKYTRRLTPGLAKREKKTSTRQLKQRSHSPTLEH